MKFPFYPQFDAMDCGPACLRMVAKHYGKHYSLQTLRRKCFITREGVSMLGISDAAESIGMRTLGVRIPLDRLASEAQLPCILHWESRHFVVLYKVKRKRNGEYVFYVADPASCLVKYPQCEFEKYWCNTTTDARHEGIALFLSPGTGFNREEDEPEYSSGRDILFFTQYLKPYKTQFVQLVMGVLLGGVMQLVFPFLTQAMVDVGIGGRNLGFITLILLAQLTMFFAQLVIVFIRSWIMLHINSRISITLISDFLTKLMKLPLHYFDMKMTGDIMQRIGDHARIKSFLMGNSVNIIFFCY